VLQLATNNTNSIIQFLKTAALVIAISILSLLAAAAALVGTCSMIFSAASGLNKQTSGMAILGLVLEVIAVLLVSGIYFMIKSQMGNGRK